ncbi:MAG: L-aminopeptidase/D-esterase-like protein [Thermoproteota archaeon]
MSDNTTLTAIAGITVGHYTDSVAQTGCTVIVLPEPSIVAGEIRGAAPATREYGLLCSGMTVEQANALVITGGSAFGLASADGVMAELETQGRGYTTTTAVVPIVPAAALYDLGVGSADVRPTARDGAQAFRVASNAPVQQGLVGAGTGATCGKWRGEKIRGGIGSAAVRIGEVTVAALVAVNALGDVFSLEGAPLTGGPAVAKPLAIPPVANQNTTLGVVATDAALTRDQLSRLLVRAHDAYGACIRPAHTSFDGDMCFAVSAGTQAGELHNLAEAAFEAVGRAIANAIVASQR